MAKKPEAGKTPAERLAALFEGNKRSSGRFDPKTGKGWQPHDPVQLADWEAHIAGKLGVGTVPIQDDNTCWWGVIDCDNHDTDEDLPLKMVAEKIEQLKLPLIPCRSKSGGIHAYAFFAEPLPAIKVKTLLTSWSGLIGFGGHEVFPKQTSLTGGLKAGGAGTPSLGNWVNAPYFDSSRTARYAVYGGELLSLDQFLDYAERLRITDKQLRALASAEHPDAPPCIQHFYSHGVAPGHRNETLYNITVYLKKSHPDAIEAKAAEANQAIFTKPLAKIEFGRTVASASRPDMQYRCSEEPLRSVCDRESCLKRKFGITPADAERLATADSLPPFTGLVKYLSEPVRWEMSIDGIKVGLKTEALLDWRCIRQVIAERLTKVVPMIKNQEWERMLAPLMKEARIVETPDDASISGVIRDRLREFAAKTDLTSIGQDTEDRKALLRGLPVVSVVDGDRCVVFRGQDFINYLKRTKSEELKGVDLWMAVKAIGVTHVRMRPGKGADLNPIDVWCLPVREVTLHLQQAPNQEFKSEL